MPQRKRELVKNVQHYISSYSYYFRITSAASVTKCSYDIPTTDPACAAISSKSTAETIMSKCCGAASIVAINNCAYYCLTQGQTVAELAECLNSNGLYDSYCNAAANATDSATATVSATSTGTVTDLSASSTTTTGGAKSTFKGLTSNVGVLALLFYSTLF
ncbi:hypothetical protein BGW36DRAFT_430652 [Talaromyces proteolyticus]|uniref:Uncharacterized protein n=1 Tax=Talaromyces proteolyticus TaxID=1131652 RepID=A0AAD4KK77_9EURO|nr:uncharacterized protein BGW36DRAFT_430652 [Talaromyces proteolyticus]KAH8692908.1 hypothetical protein BGW36DRAFT_430652 [Talaromyces proteolyticus]